MAHALAGRSESVQLCPRKVAPVTTRGKCTRAVGAWVGSKKWTSDAPDHPRCATRPLLTREVLHGAYLQVGSPSPAVVTSGFVVLTPIPHEKFVSWLCVFVASQAPA